MILRARGREIRFPRRPLVMGIVNITPDSFSGDGEMDVARALDKAFALVRDGADIIDVGGESARTNREAVSASEEMARILPFIEGFKSRMGEGDFPKPEAPGVSPPILSVNTWRPEVAGAALAAGAEMLNDIGALPDARNAKLAARHGAALGIMHSVGAPKVSHRHITYPDILSELDRFFEDRIQMAGAAGLAPEQIFLDPGIDFAKGVEDNLTVLREAGHLLEFGRPVLLPVSRKSVIGRVVGEPNPIRRDPGTLACLVRGVVAGMHIFRVHNVRAATDALDVLGAVRGGW